MNDETLVCAARDPRHGTTERCGLELAHEGPHEWEPSLPADDFVTQTCTVLAGSDSGVGLGSACVYPAGHRDMHSFEVAKAVLDRRCALVLPGSGRCLLPGDHTPVTGHVFSNDPRLSRSYADPDFARVTQSFEDEVERDRRTASPSQRCPKISQDGSIACGFMRGHGGRHSFERPAGLRRIGHEPGEGADIGRPADSVSIRDLGMSKRAIKPLEAHDIRTLGGMRARGIDALATLEGVGVNCIAEYRAVLGLPLETIEPEFPGMPRAFVSAMDHAINNEAIHPNDLTGVERHNLAEAMWADLFKQGYRWIDQETLKRVARQGSERSLELLRAESVGYENAQRDAATGKLEDHPAYQAGLKAGRGDAEPPGAYARGRENLRSLLRPKLHQMVANGPDSPSGAHIDYGSGYRKATNEIAEFLASLPEYEHVPPPVTYAESVIRQLAYEAAGLGAACVMSMKGAQHLVMPTADIEEGVEKVLASRGLAASVGPSDAEHEAVQKGRPVRTVDDAHEFMRGWKASHEALREFVVKLQDGAETHPIADTLGLVIDRLEQTQVRGDVHAKAPAVTADELANFIADVMAAVAFLFFPEVPDELADPSTDLVVRVAELVKLRREAGQ